MFRNILAAVDGSPFGEHSLPFAMSIARQCGGMLELAHVHVPGSKSPREARLGYLDQLALRVRSRVPDVEIRTALLEKPASDRVADELARHADNAGVDLLVLNSHPRGALARWWHGNLAEELVRRTSAAVLALPGLEHELLGERLPRFWHMLLPLDGTADAEQILPFATAMARCMEASVTLLRVVEPAPVPVADPVCATAADYDRGLEARLADAADTYLERVAGRLREGEAPLTVRTAVAIDAEPAEAISEHLAGRATGAAAPPPIDLVAVATHGREGLSRLLRGSVAERVLRHSSLPLLLRRCGDGG